MNNFLLELKKNKETKKSKRNNDSQLNKQAVNEHKRRVLRNGVRFNFNSIRTKLVLLFILLIIIPVTVIEQISISTISDNLILKAKESLSSATSQTHNYYELNLNQISKGYALELAFNLDILKYIESESYSNSLDKFTQNAKAEKGLQNIIATYNDIFSSAILVKTNGESLGYPVKFDSSVNLTDTPWYKKIAQSNESMWMEGHPEGLPDTYDNDYVLSYCVPLKDIVKSQLKGVLVLDIKPNAFQKILSSINVGKNAHSYAVLNNHQVISDNSKNHTKDDISFDTNILLKKAQEYSSKKDSMVFTQEYEGENFIVSYEKSKTTGWIFVTTLPESEITAVTKSIQTNIMLFAILFIIIAVFIGVMFSFNLTKDMKKLMGTMDKVKNGELGVKTSSKRKDEIGKLTDSFNSMLLHIRKLVSQSKELSENLSDSSTKIANITGEANNISTGIGKAIQEVAEGASKQASEAENSLSAMTGLSDKISDVVESIHFMERVSEDVRQITVNGINTSKALNKKTIETTESTHKAVSKINQLNDYVSGINKITNTLKGIAAQTRLLSLNATIEAARAGESGKGFGVVADEIRKLAEQSNESTKEIEVYVGSILSETNAATSAVENTDKVIHEQYSIVQETELAFNNINNSVKSLLDNINNILSESVSMDDFKGVVFTSIHNTSAVSDETAAVSEEVYASVEQYLAFITDLDTTALQLKDLSQDLTLEMDKFQL